jgi:hypothetical protein
MIQTWHGQHHTVGQTAISRTDVQNADITPVQQAPHPVEEIDLIDRVEEVATDYRVSTVPIRPAPECPVLVKLMEQTAVVDGSNVVRISQVLLSSLSPNVTQLPQIRVVAAEILNCQILEPVRGTPYRQG